MDVVDDFRTAKYIKLYMHWAACVSVCHQLREDRGNEARRNQSVQLCSLGSGHFERF